MTPEAQEDFDAVLAMQATALELGTPEQHRKAERARLDVEAAHGVQIKSVMPVDSPAANDPGIRARHQRRPGERFSDAVHRICESDRRLRIASGVQSRGRESRRAAPGRRAGSRRTTGAAASSSDDPGGDPEPGEAGPNIDPNGGEQ